MRYAEYEQKLQYLKVSVENLAGLLDSRPVKRWAYLIHDKDQHPDGSPKDPHIHVMMELRSDNKYETVAKWFNDEPEHIEKAKDPRNPYESMCSYLIHDIPVPTPPGNHHYDPEEVTANFNFPEFIAKVRAGVETSKQIRSKKHPIQDVLEAIANNEIPRIKIDDHLSSMDQIRFARDIEQAYKIRDRRIAKENDRDMNVVYMSGPSGTGKTTYAKMFAKKFGYDVFVSGSSNDPLEGYQGQEAIILDDIRGSDWKINDLLKLLDNNTNSLAKSRYSNKLLNDCKMMILTSVQSIEDLYSGLREHDSEPIEQLKRRCSTLITFTDDDRISFHAYRSDLGDYETVSTMPNPIHMLRAFVQNKSQVKEFVSMIETLTDDAIEENNKEYHRS